MGRMSRRGGRGTPRRIDNALGGVFKAWNILIVSPPESTSTLCGATRCRVEYTLGLGMKQVGRGS